MRGLSKGAFAAAVLVGLSHAISAWAQGTTGSAPSETQTRVERSGPAQAVAVLGSRQAQGVLGREVRSTANEYIGRVVDVVVDQAGQVRAAVIDFGGFLGVGSRKIAVDWNALRFSDAARDKSDAIILELTRDKLAGAPEYKDKREVIVLGSAGGLGPRPDE